MSSNKFTVTYPSGLGTHVEICDAQTVEDFVNRFFGSVDPDEHGVTIEMEPMVPVEEDEAVEPATTGIPAPNAVKSPLEGDDMQPTNGGGE